MEKARDFHHPYQPYDIQESFMNIVYETLQDGKVGIMESPTGTGKSLSLICGSLTWLRDHQQREFENGLDWDANDTKEPQWLIDQTKARKRREMLRQREVLQVRLEKIRAKERVQKQRYLDGDQHPKKRRMDDLGSELEGDSQFELEEYQSDDEQVTSRSTKDGLYSTETLALMESLGMSMKAKDLNEEQEEHESGTKIFYCSRTHSQLSQFINELRRPKFPPSIQDEAIAGNNTEELKHVTLGSRKNLCINPNVNRLASLTAINEKCTELQQPATSQEQKCPFLPNKENQALVNEFRDHTLSELRDIEDMGSLGKQIGICPYYASRSAINTAEIITLPYPLLLQKSAREALSLDLKNHVIIIDEAHNLMDALAGIYSVEITLCQLTKARSQLGAYLQRFRKRLKGRNRVYVAQTVRIIDSISAYLQNKLSSNTSALDGNASDKEILSGKGVDQINIQKLVSYLQESKLARKVEGYALHAANTENNNVVRSTKLQSTELDTSVATPVLHQITAMLQALTHPTSEGQFFFNKSPGSVRGADISLKFQLLDVSNHFAEIVSSARAVILAGGTMSPMSDYTSHLFPLLPAERINTLSCGHVIPRENLIAWNLSKGPSNIPFEFTFRNRTNIEMIDELGRALLNICSIVPDGIVVFFPSYQALSDITKRWNTASPNAKSIMARLESKKLIFRESKEESVESVLSLYAQAIDKGKGGLLLSVVGGKMSEGINFSDTLGRCVVIIGLPFPNVNSAEWKAKLSYIENSTAERLMRIASSKIVTEEISRKAKEEAREFYENACMRAVNQSVGRAIRHKGDFASVIMIDKRFEKETIMGKLPGWIKEGLVAAASEKNFGALMSQLGTFYRVKRSP